MKKISVMLLILVGFVNYSQEKINQFDDKGERHGLWKGIYEESKRPRYEGIFEHGKEIGLFKYFDDTKAGKVIATRDFSRGNGTCYVTMFDRKENKVSEGLLINKEYEEEWKYYHKESKVVMSSENYKKGKQQEANQPFEQKNFISQEKKYQQNKEKGYKEQKKKG